MRTSAVLVVLAVIHSPPPVAAATIVATEAADVCSPSTDPCVIRDTVKPIDGAILDFGARRVEIVSPGKLDIGAGEVEVRCGELRTAVGETLVIDVRGPAGPDGSEGGFLTIVARRACSVGGAVCLTDAGCAGGTCTVGTGNVVLDGVVRADAAFPGLLAIEAAGSVSLMGQVVVSSTDAEGDGGFVDVLAYGGSITVDAAIEAVGGRLASGGEVVLTAGQDVIVRSSIDVSGGEFDGGVFSVEAGRDLGFSGAVHASATRLDGAGGEVSMSASRDLRLMGTAFVETDGGRSGSFSGDGGQQLYSSGRDLSVASGVVLRANGAKPEGRGGTISLVADGDATVGGLVDARAPNPTSGGGAIDVTACALTIVSGASISNDGVEGENVLTGRSSVRVEASSSILADPSSGANRVVYRDAGSRPQLSGTIVPPAVLELDPALPSCFGTPTTTHFSPTTTTPTTTTVTSPPRDCGDGLVTGSEECDGGSASWTVGRACRTDCTLVACGDPNDSGDLTAVDALFILRAAVEIEECDSCVCNVDASPGPPSSTDALRVLRAAVGAPIVLECPPCS